MSNYKKYFINKISISLSVFALFLVLGFSYAQVLTGTGDRPEDWGDNTNAVANQLLNLMNYDENGNPYTVGNNPNSGLLNSFQNLYNNQGYTYTNPNITNTNSNIINNQANQLYNVLPNANNEIMIPNTNINSNSNAGSVVNNNNNNYPCTVLRSFMSRGDSGSNVYALQTFLYHFGYMRAIPNGHFGPSTESAVIGFQSRNNIDVRGYVGPNTRARIASITCNGDIYSINLAKTPIVVYAAKTNNVNTSSNKVAVTTNSSVSVNTNNKQNNNITTTSSPSVQKENTSVSVVVNTNESSIFKKPNTVASSTASLNTGQTLTSGASLNTNSNLADKLSATSLSFTGKSKLYWTYKLSTGEKIYMCLENNKNKTCDNDEFLEVKDILGGQAYDIIKISDTWSFTLYNSTDWSQGGKVKIKSGSDVYSINIVV